ncbi:hypothetical protein D3C75_789060 [compost metagenome]
MREAEQAADCTQQIQYVQIAWGIVCEVAFLIESARTFVHKALAPGNKGIHIILITLGSQADPNTQNKSSTEHDINPSRIDDVPLLQQLVAA